MRLIDKVFKNLNVEPSDEPYASFKVVDCGDNANVSLTYRRFSGEYQWYIQIYQGNHYNGPDIAIDEFEAEKALRNLADNRDIEGTNWDDFNWFYWE